MLVLPSSPRADAWSPVVFPSLRSFDGIILCSGELQPRPPEPPSTYPEGCMRSTLPGSYLERGSVHACIQLCTRGYTVVYTRVYSSLLGRRYSLGISTPRTRILLSSAYTPPRPCPRTIVISCVSPPVQPQSRCVVSRSSPRLDTLMGLSCAQGSSSLDLQSLLALAPKAV